mgnify:CR=1 FL=1
MGALEETYPRIRELGAELLAISPQDLEHTRQTKEELGLSFVLLSDQGNHVAERFGLKYAYTEEAREAYMKLGMVLPEYNGDDSWTLPIPATYVVDQTGRIVFSQVDSDYTRRGEPGEILATLKELKTAEASHS